MTLIFNVYRTFDYFIICAERPTDIMFEKIDIY